MNAHACCRCRSSRATLSFPRCLADKRSTSPGRKYGRYRFKCDVDADASIIGIDSTVVGKWVMES